MVRIETWFHPDGRIGAARNWVMRNAETGEVFGRSTRYYFHFPSSCVPLCNQLLTREGSLHDIRNARLVSSSAADASFDNKPSIGGLLILGLKTIAHSREAHTVNAVR